MSKEEEEEDGAIKSNLEGCNWNFARYLSIFHRKNLKFDIWEVTPPQGGLAESLCPTKKYDQSLSANRVLSLYVNTTV